MFPDNSGHGFKELIADPGIILGKPKMNTARLALLLCCRWLVAALLLATSNGMPSSRGSEPGADPAKAIRAVIERQEADWNRGNLDGFLTGYWNSPKVVFQSGGDRFDGWEAMRDRYRKRYRSEGKAMGQVAFSRVEIEMLGPESALVRGAWRLTMPDGSRPGGLFTLVFRRFPDGWKIIHDHTSAEEPAKAKAG